jgi:hypothetical protein
MTSNMNKTFTNFGQQNNLLGNDNERPKTSESSQFKAYASIQSNRGKTPIEKFRALLNRIDGSKSSRQLES